MRHKPRTALVKLTRPRLFDAVHRPRLYDLLDQLLQHPLVWITGPPGAGKTTLVASYIESRKRPCLWYQLDAGDADPGTLFHYLDQGSAEQGRASTPLPPFDVQFLKDLRGFARRYFRELFGRLRPTTILVVDNLEDARSSSMAIEVLRAAAGEIPHRCNMIISSREHPPQAFAQLAISQAMVIMDAAALRFTDEEARGVAQLAGVEDLQAVSMLWEQTDGWAAGLRLLAEHARGGAPLASPLNTSSRQALFDYFAEQVFGHAAPEVETTLVRLALLPQITPQVANEVSGRRDCATILDDLARRQLFVQRRAASLVENEPGIDHMVYQFHALFQTFLREHAVRTLGKAALQPLALRSARAMEGAECLEAAIELYLEAGEWNDAVRLMRSTIPRLLHNSRLGLPVRWISLLPPAIRDNDPWLLFWSGSGHAGQDPVAARALLERAHGLARQHGEHALAAQAAAAVIETLFLDYTRFEPLDAWIAILEAALADEVEWADLRSELRTCSALLSAVLYRRGDPPTIASIATHTLDLLHKDVDADLKLTAGAWLLSYGANLGKLDFAASVLPVVEPLLGRADLSPLRRGLCAYFVAWYYVMRVDYERSLVAFDRLAGIARDFPLPRLQIFASIISFWMEVIWHPHSDLSQHIRDFERVINPAHPYELASLQAMRAWNSLTRGDAEEGLQAARAAVSAYELFGSPWHRLLARGIALWASADLGDRSTAQSVIADMRRIAACTNVRVYDAYIHQAHAWLALQAGDEERLVQHLHALFEQARSYGTGLPPRFVPVWMPRLAGEALQRGIETSYVRRLIFTYGWPPPARESQAWPYPVRVYVLGRFEVEMNGATLSFTGKAPRKTLALLKALVCMGGKEVRDHQLIDALWPDEEADAARKVFGVTLHRLRRLLGAVETIDVTEGCVSLNPNRVWVDALVFERLLSASATPAEDDIRRALALYQGPLLPGDLDASWSAPARERLRAKFVHQVARRGRELESMQSWDEALALYMRGLDADQLNESFYCGLMRVHHLCGRRAEAMSLYARLQQVLAATLGIEPSREAHALYEEVSRERPHSEAVSAWRRNGSRRR